MDRGREDVRDDLLALLNASRELSTADNEILAETFLSRLERRPRRRDGFPSLTSACFAALAVLVAIPLVMIAQTYSALDGYLPPLDAGALPAIYWIALALVLILLIAQFVANLTGWRMQLTVTRDHSQ